jgi:predicted dehydrogenase
MWRRPVLVNYFRAFTPFYQAFAESVKADTWGALRRATIHYGGTLESHGCHALERLIFSFGAPTASESLAGDAAAPLLRLSFEAGAEALLVPARGPSYSVFEIDHFFERGRVRIVDGERRVELFEAGADADFPGYRSLRPADAKLPPLSHELHGSVAALVAAARRGRDDSGTLSRAVAVARVVHAIVRPDA